MGLTRYQRGYVKKVGKKQEIWYGWFREVVRLPDGSFRRRQVKRKIGAVSDFPTQSAAYEELSRLLNLKPSVEMKFSELVSRWQVAVVPTIKTTTAAYYQKNPRAHLVPTFGNNQISTIGRYEVETFLAEHTATYRRNSLRGMRVSLGRVMSWAVACGWLDKNPCAGVKLPNAGKRITRTILTPEQTIAIAKKRSEPYATLVLFMAVTGLRIGEAIGIKWSDFDGNVLRIGRRIYEGKIGTTKTAGSERSLPIPVVLLVRMRLLGDGEWVFRSAADTPVNPGNMLKRNVRPVLKELGIEIGGWHDFRHTLATNSLKRWPTKAISEILGHSNVLTTMKIYQHTTTEDFRGPLDEIARELLPDVTKSVSVN